MSRLLVLLLAVGLSSAFQRYQSEIPNGDKVPDPSSSSTWMGVGHNRASGGGPRNKFGMDFAANNHVWDATLCNKDSDSDGKTNGMELGDPSCVWTKGDTPASSTGISHPGICEPIDSSACTEINSSIDIDSGAPLSSPGVGILMTGVLSALWSLILL